MARLVMVVFMLVMFLQTAFAVVDPRPDVLGVYFDEYGNLPCKDDLQVAVPFSVWIVYTRPSVTSIQGFEAGYHTTTEFIQLGLYPPCGIVWVIPPELDNLYIACDTPMVTNLATPLLRIEYLYLGSEAFDSIFYLEKARDSSQPGTNPYIILADGSPMEVQAGGSAYTSFICALPMDEVGWGTIKSLYR